MSTDEHATDEQDASASVSVSDDPAEDGQEAKAPKRKLEIAVDISDVGPCKKHLKIIDPARGDRSAV